MALSIPKLTEADVHAVRAVISGKADSGQQIRAMEWIARELCRIFDSPYVADGDDRETFIAIGRHQVGVMITAMTTEPVLNAARAADEAKKSPARVFDHPVPRPTRRGKTK